VAEIIFKCTEPTAVAKHTDVRYCKARRHLTTAQCTQYAISVYYSVIFSDDPLLKYGTLSLNHSHVLWGTKTHWLATVYEKPLPRLAGRFAGDITRQRPCWISFCTLNYLSFTFLLAPQTLKVRYAYNSKSVTVAKMIQTPEFTHSRKPSSYIWKTMITLMCQWFVHVKKRNFILILFNNLFTNLLLFIINIHY
jgi:hypothetical protein